MPTLFTVDGVRVVIYPNDHPPSHVHAVTGEAKARFRLNCPSGPVELMDAEGFRRSMLDRVGREIAVHLDDCCGKWSTLHG
jgi:hypothetical protein